MELIGSVIHNILKKNGKEDIFFGGILKSKWIDIVGNTIAKESNPEYINNKTLYISCKNPAFKQEIFFLKSRIIERINNNVSDNLIEDIKVFMKRR